jgi:hypothetical protein
MLANAQVDLSTAAPVSARVVLGAWVMANAQVALSTEALVSVRVGLAAPALASAEDAQALASVLVDQSTAAPVSAPVVLGAEVPVNAQVVALSAQVRLAANEVISLEVVPVVLTLGRGTDVPNARVALRGPRVSVPRIQLQARADRHAAISRIATLARAAKVAMHDAVPAEVARDSMRDAVPAEPVRIVVREALIAEAMRHAMTNSALT